MSDSAQSLKIDSLIIAGCHRSGTSTATHWLERAGVHLSDDLLGSAPSNPDGHFEDRAIVRLHDRMLEAAGGNWHSPPDVGQVATDAHDAFQRATIGKVGVSKVWGFKDPRATLFLPVWRRVLPNSACILLFRDPADCVASLLKRQADTLARRPKASVHENFFWQDPDHAVRLWCRYNQAVLDAVASSPKTTLLVDYAAMREGYPLIEAVNARFDLDLDADVGSPVMPASPCLEHRSPWPLPVNSDLAREADALYEELREHAAIGAFRRRRIQRPMRRTGPVTQLQFRRRLGELGLSISTDDSVTAIGESTSGRTDSPSIETQALGALRSHLAAGRQAAAIEFLRSLPDSVRQHAPLAVEASRLFEASGDFKMAYDWLEAAVGANLRPIGPRLQLALLEQRRGSIESARARLDALLEEHPGALSLHLHRIRLDANGGRTASARSAIEHARQSVDDPIAVEAETIACLRSEGRLADARQRLEQGLASHPDHPAIATQVHALALAEGLSSRDALPLARRATWLRLSGIVAIDRCFEVHLTQVSEPRRRAALRHEILRAVEALSRSADDAMPKAA